MAKDPNNPFNKVSLVELLKGAFKDLRDQSRYFKGTLQDLRRGLGYLLARPIRTSLTLVTIVGLVFLVSFFVYGQEGRIKAHLEKADARLAAGDFDDAILHYEKAFKLGGVDDPATYLSYVNALLGMGDDKKTRRVLTRLAPGPGHTPGLEEIHRLIALGHSDKLSESQSTNLRNFKWHLDHSGKVDSTELNLAWARYNIATSDLRGAVPYMQAAAADDPKYYALVIAYQEKLGQKEQLEKSVTEARPKIEKLVKMNPKDDSSRVLFSRILFHMGALEECEQVLLKGVEVSNSQTIKDACCNFYLEQYLRKKRSSSFNERFGLLQKAFLMSSRNDGPTIELDKMYRTAKSSEEKAAIKAFLQDATENQELAIRAHTFLTLILWSENKREEALEHAEKCYDLDATSPIAANNLASQISQSPKPDLNRALELSRFAVGKWPRHAVFRDTLGTILMKMNRYQEATVEFQSALALKIDNPKAIHKKLAFNYDKLGFKELAQRHDALSKPAKVGN